ncbi:MAG: UDP-N-acetylglucosamine 1-carboxyvinyltransferase [Actinobacteria bacterium]|nr:UDP-N-acetylglucosamine 1-carboxyvinyltransferase [Actinomycetota bacterium]
MDRIVVQQSGPLSGQADVPGAKNSVLKLMVASLYAPGRHELTNVPDISDVETMGALLGALGVRARRDDVDGSVLHLYNDGDVGTVAPSDLVSSIRASINVLGPLLAVCGRVRLDMPGGDDFGTRPIDLHLAGLRAMGVEFEIDDRSIVAYVDRLRGADIVLDFPSVGATENLVTAAVQAEGSTTITNAAREPEVADLCELLVEMGAHIEGIGSSVLSIEGVERGSLVPVSHAVVPDRIQAATYLAAVAVAGGSAVIKGARADHMAVLLNRMNDMGLQLEAVPGGVSIVSEGRMRAVDVQTLPFPGLATDYKPLLVTMLAVAEGMGIVTENLYPGRFRYVEELSKLGADIRTDGHHAIVRGMERLRGAAVVAPDIRAGAALVIAGLAAEGRTVISGIEHIDRGYDDLVGRLVAMGASVTRANSVDL